MSPAPTIRLSEVTHIDKVIVAVTPLDTFSGKIVRLRPEDIELCNAAGVNLHKRAIANLSGKLVFVRRFQIVGGVETALEPQEDKYLIKLRNTAKYGYFTPAPEEFTPPANHTADAREIKLALQPLPSAALPEGATTFRGIIVSNGQAQPDVIVSAELPAALLPPGMMVSPFAARTDSSGAFTLATRLPPEASGSEEAITFRLTQAGATLLVFNIPITEQIVENGVEKKVTRIKYEAAHGFTRPIELTDANPAPALHINAWST